MHISVELRLVSAASTLDTSRVIVYKKPILDTQPPQDPLGPERPPTIKMVAAEAQVSTATVSRVLAGLDGVGDEVRARVLFTVRKLDYQPNRLARGLRARQRKVVGVLIPDLQNPFFTGVVHGIETVLYDKGFTLLLGHSGGLAEREQTHLSVLRGEGAAGLIFIPGNSADANYESIRNWRIPIVAVDRVPSGLEVDLVATENRQGVRTAIDHLLSHGYREIALINGPEGFSVTRERFEGYAQSLASAGIALRKEYVASADFKQIGGRDAMARLLDLPAPPRAVLIANNLMTLGALEAIHGRGLNIPGDIALICFDDMPWSTSLRPPITAIAQPAEEIGRTAAELLLDRLQNTQRLPRHVTLPTSFIVRSSCGAHSSQPM